MRMWWLHCFIVALTLYADILSDRAHIAMCMLLLH
jgi:hypothetical protein